jgi:hypothetical protein
MLILIFLNFLDQVLECFVNLSELILKTLESRSLLQLKTLKMIDPYLTLTTKSLPMGIIRRMQITF